VKHRFRRFLLILGLILLIAMVFKLMNGITVQASGIYEMNEKIPEQIQNHISHYIEYEDIPIDFINALISTEDKRFFRHRGFDPVAIVRATYANIKAGKYKQGASTITQQLAKNLFLSGEKSLDRKLKEVSLALTLEKNYTKKEILEMYANVIYFGDGAYGLQAASQRFFGKNAKNLTLDECTLLVGSLVAPTVYNPHNSKRAADRQEVVLFLMKKNGFLKDAKNMINIHGYNSVNL